MSKVLKGLKGDLIEVTVFDEMNEPVVFETTIESVKEKENGHWVYSFLDDEGHLLSSENVKLI